jgi:hypothetical protein
LKENLLATVQGIEELDGRQQVGEHNVGWVDQERAHQSSKTIANKLTADESEDTDSGIGLNKGLSARQSARPRRLDKP